MKYEGYLTIKELHQVLLAEGLMMGKTYKCISNKLVHIRRALPELKMVYLSPKEGGLALFSPEAVAMIREFLKEHRSSSDFSTFSVDRQCVLSVPLLNVVTLLSDENLLQAHAAITTQLEARGLRSKREPIRKSRVEKRSQS